MMDIREKIAKVLHDAQRASVAEAIVPKIKSRAEFDAQRPPWERETSGFRGVYLALADEVLAIPEIADGQALKRKFDAQRETVRREWESDRRTMPSR